MRKSRIVICIFTAVFLVLAGLIGFFLWEPTGDFPFSVLISNNGKTEQIECFYNGKNDVFLFLPSYAELSKTQIKLDTNNVVSINGAKLTEGLSCENFKFDTQYKLTYNKWGNTLEKNITFLKSGDVAAMHIDTQSGSMDYIHSKKGNKETGKIRLYSASGNTEYEGDLNSIKGRGNNTWEAFDKKPYSLTLSREGNLLCLGTATEWVLLSNAADPSNLRNKIVYDFAKNAGFEYSPDAQFVDLYLNGEYVGLYLLSERNEVHTERVAINSNNSFLASFEKEDRLQAQNYTYISTDTKRAIRFHYPKNISSGLLAEFEQICQSAENAIISDNGIDSATGKAWQEFIDLDSWGKKFLIEEVFGNLDAGLTSQYFYLDNNLLYAGPVWDYDHAIGNGLDKNWSISNPNTFVVNRPKYDTVQDNQWFKFLYKKDSFYNHILKIYQSEYLPLLQKLIDKDIDIYAESIGLSAKMNELRWDSDIKGDDLLNGAKEIKEYLSEHTKFLSDVWLEKAEYHQVYFKNSEGNEFYYHLKSGEQVGSTPTVADTETSTFLGWYYTDTDEPFDSTKPIYEDIEVYAKWEEKGKIELDDIIKLAPIGIIAVMFLILLFVAVKQTKNGGDGIWKR
ncbi:MAG: CotH kinase family protein [Oscillospiraceae bacterium]|nr:CotH kinase family protein [Oscillospiraceae bacterium]